MQALAALAVGLTEIVFDRSVWRLRLTMEALVLRLGLVVACTATALAAGGFFVAVLYDVTASAWGATPAKLLVGVMLACVSLAFSVAILRGESATTRLRRRG